MEIIKAIYLSVYFALLLVLLIHLLFLVFYKAFKEVKEYFKMHFVLGLTASSLFFLALSPFVLIGIGLIEALFKYIIEIWR